MVKAATPHQFCIFETGEGLLTNPSRGQKKSGVGLTFVSKNVFY
jgi:hypothetical protein